MIGQNKLILPLLSCLIAITIPMTTADPALQIHNVGEVVAIATNDKSDNATNKKNIVFMLFVIW